MWDEARDAIAKSSKNSSVYIGTDSLRYKRNNKWYAKYSTCVILHINSNNGCRVFHNTISLPDYGNLKQRLLNEVSLAVEAALAISDVVGERPMSVHLDINSNPKYKSNIAVKEALGWVRGELGIEATIKPYAWASSHAADHILRNTH